MLEAVGALLAIFRDNLLPVFLLMGLGYGLQRRFGLDMKTLSRVNIYVFVPALACWALSQAKLALVDLVRVFAFVMAIELAMYLIARIWARARGYSVGMSSAFACALMFYNSGNYGYPLIALLYGAKSAAVGLQAIVLATQNLSSYSLGQVIIRGPQMGVKKALIEYFKMPFAYAILIGLLLQQTPLKLPGFAMHTIELAAGGLVPIALLTLGAQLALVRWNRGMRSVATAATMRLVGGPVVAYALLKLFGVHGWMAEMLLISSAVPTAVNTTIMAIEFENEPEFAAQAVFVSTLLSSVTVAVVIFVARRLFGG